MGSHDRFGALADITTPTSDARFTPPLNITLRREGGKLVWKVHGLRVADDYESVASVVVTTSSDFRKSTLNPADLGGFTDIQLAETRRRETLERMIGNLARDVYDSIMEDF